MLEKILSKKSTYLVGTIDSIVDNSLYTVKVSVPNFMTGKLCYPLEFIDEPVAGDEVILFPLDSIVTTTFYYAPIRVDSSISMNYKGNTIDLKDSGFDIITNGETSFITGGALTMTVGGEMSLSASGDITMSSSGAYEISNDITDLKTVIQTIIDTITSNVVVIGSINNAAKLAEATTLLNSLFK